MKLQRIVAGAAFVGLVAAMSACSTTGGDSGSATVNWWTWDERQAASYEKCLPGFAEEHPDIEVKISQYAVDDYFTKLTAGFVSGSAPDAFQNSVPLLGAYAGQGQIMALDDLIEESGFDLSVFDVGVDSWKFTDGQQYGLPLDWAAAAFYFDQDAVEAAGLTADDIQNMTFDPETGGTFVEIVKRLTVDVNGVRGDEPGFDKDNVATYGIGSLAAPDFNGQTSWNGLVSSTGWRLGDKASWPTKFNYDDPRFEQSLELIRGLADQGFSPEFGEFTVSGAEQLGSGKVAMVEGGSWDATTMAKIPDRTIGFAPMPEGSDGRKVISNSNANNIFVGTKNLDATWAWVTYMGSEACQSAAGVDGTFLPSIAASMQVAADAQAEQGVDLSIFTEMLANNELYAAPPTVNGQEVVDTIHPLFEAYWSHERDSDVFAEMAQKTEEIFAE